MAAQLDGNGRRTGELLELDTTHLNFTSDNKLYAVVSSEDRKRIALFKINSSDRDTYKMTKLLFNDKLSLLGRTEVLIPMSDRGDQLGDFALDNQGDLLFSRFLRGNNDNVTKASMLILPATSSSLQEVSLPVSEKGPFLDELKVKVDNLNQRYILTSLYSDERKSGIDGCFFYVWDKQSRQPLVNSLHEFTDELRQEAKGNATTRTAFNDFFIRQIIATIIFMDRLLWASIIFTIVLLTITGIGGGLHQHSGGGRPLDAPTLPYGIMPTILWCSPSILVGNSNGVGWSLKHSSMMRPTICYLFL
jgi:hypothetical protein